MTTVVYRGQTDVMRWCGGVTRPAISNWITRHPGSVPEPDAIIANEGIEIVTRGWKPERKDEWMEFAAARLGSHGGRPSESASGNAVRRAADAITRQAEAGEITERTAIKLLAAMIGTTPVTTTEKGTS